MPRPTKSQPASAIPWDERMERREAIEEAVAIIEEQGYFMDRQTEQLCQDFIAGRFTPDEIVRALLKPRLH